MTPRDRAEALHSASARLGEAQRIIVRALCDLVGKDPVSETRTATAVTKAMDAVNDAQAYLTKVAAKPPI